MIAQAIRTAIPWCQLIAGRRYRFRMNDGRSMCATFYGWGCRCTIVNDRKFMREAILQWGQFIWEGRANHGGFPNYDDAPHELHDVDQAMPLSSVIGLVEKISELRQ